MSEFSRQLEKQFKAQKRGWGKQNLMGKQLYPYSLVYLRRVMQDMPKSAASDPEAFEKWVMKNKSKRLRVYLRYFSRHWCGIS